ncbi:MAG: bifunctional phosphoribosyl-AMP cyclohydrolase/phosphoribosyl-ATP diphosphatase HisIE [Proteobacteria bacterium]|nr:bifunctional phosphoribosyl-AMP cyclohydrolase/phosphoribosyl-ATP diphosphatase HisIE [Pseudomonadota bacterium]
MKDLRLNLNWKKVNGLIPAIVQDAETDVVLMLGYMNREALEKTFQTRKVWFYSRAKGRLWMKGETSGNTLALVSVKSDCDNDALLVKVLPKGPTCHTGSHSCFDEKERQEILRELYAVLRERKNTLPEGSYTAFLFTEGLDKICGKIDEESAEVVLAARKESKQRLVEESVDVLYHLFVLLVHRGVTYSELIEEVTRRRKA